MEQSFAATRREEFENLKMQRSAGILLPVFSLPGPYGIGTLGKEARAFADFLKAAGQR